MKANKRIDYLAELYCRARQADDPNLVAVAESAMTAAIAAEAACARMVMAEAMVSRALSFMSTSKA